MGGCGNGRAESARRIGRQRANSRTEHVAFRLFDEQGFEHASVDDVANLLELLDQAFHAVAGEPAGSETGAAPSPLGQQPLA